MAEPALLKVASLGRASSLCLCCKGINLIWWRLMLSHDGMTFYGNHRSSTLSLGLAYTGLRHANVLKVVHSAGTKCPAKALVEQKGMSVQDDKFRREPSPSNSHFRRFHPSLSSLTTFQFSSIIYHNLFAHFRLGFPWLACRFGT